MDTDRLCAQVKERVAQELQEAADPMARVEVLIQALYETSRSVLPALGTPRKSTEYQKAQAAVADLVSCIAIPLIRAGVGGGRGIAVLSELAEECRDPFLKKKLKVYAQELLSISQRVSVFSKIPMLPLIIASCVVAAFMVYIVWPGSTPAPKMASSAATAATAVPGVQGAPPASTQAQLSCVAASSLQRHETRVAAAVTAALQGEQVTRVRIVNSQVLVPVTLSHGGASVRLELLLDTGATRTAVHESVAGRLQIDPRQARSAMAELADGRMVGSRIARIDLLTVGPFAHPSLEVELICYGGSDAMHDGLLGMDVLGKHRYQIDMEHELIRWF
ncbi:MAG TPA: peptidase [Geobacter sp.]|nr:peptidase [Geobacter sp.]